MENHIAEASWEMDCRAVEPRLRGGILFPVPSADPQLLYIGRVCNSIMNTHIVYLRNCDWIKPKESQPIHHLSIVV